MGITLSKETRIGITNRLASREQIREAVKMTEAAGLDSIWCGEHIMYTGPIHDPFTRLAQAAAYTETLTFGTAVYLLPLRRPVPVAKQVITLDHLCDGRFIFGAGVGGEFPKEFEACGVPLNERGARLSEGLDVLKALWQGGPHSHHGKFLQFEDIELQPPPLQPGGPPIWLGGRQPPALRRIGRKADGWMSYVVTAEQYAAGLETINEASDAANRDIADFGTSHLLFICLADSPEAGLDRATALLSERYAMDFRRAAQRYAAYGPPESLAEKMTEFHAAGVRHFVLDFLGSPDEEKRQLEAFSERVKPLLDFAR